MIALIPAAGRGVRMQAYTEGHPKELVPLGRKAVLRRVMEEALEADPDRLVVVNSRLKPEIDEQVENWRTQFPVPIDVIYQDEPRGLADAVASAGISDSCVVLVGDSVFHGGSPVARMASLLFRGIDGCIAVEGVSDEDTSRYGIVEVDEGNGAVQRILEKPGPKATSSRWAVAARFAFGDRLMAFVNEFCSDPEIRSQPSEITLTTVIQKALELDFDIRAVATLPCQDRIDCGSIEEYEQARRLNWD